MKHFHAVGYTTANVTVKGGRLKTTLAPRPAGSIVNVKMDGSAKALGYETVKLVSLNTQYYRGLYIDPSLSEEERWIMGRNSGLSQSICALSLEREQGKKTTDPVDTTPRATQTYSQIINPHG